MALHKSVVEYRKEFDLLITEHKKKSSMSEMQFKKYLSANPKILVRIKRNNEISLKAYYAKRIPLQVLIEIAQKGHDHGS